MGVNADEEDTDVVKTVRSHAVRKGVRIIHAKVIRNRYCDDVVGCKLLVPKSQVSNLLEDDFWPDNIECRYWLREKPGMNQPSGDTHQNDNDQWRRERNDYRKDYRVEETRNRGEDVREWREHARDDDYYHDYEYRSNYRDAQY